MKLSVTLLTYLLLSIPRGQSQNLLNGKVFVNDKLDQIEFVNDTVMASTTGSFPDRYTLKKRKLSFAYSKKQPDDHNPKSFKIIRFSADSILVTCVQLLDPKPDTTLFVNLEKVIIPINHFDSLKIFSRGQRSYRILTIRSDKSVRLTEAIGSGFYQNHPVYTQGILIEWQYQYFLDMLSKSLIFKLPAKREYTATDQAMLDIIIWANHQNVMSKGGSFSGTHEKLMSYLWALTGKMWPE